MHNNSKAQLEALKNQAMLFLPRPNRRLAFLNGLGPIHFAWHTNARSHGFLLFHWEVIKQFKAVGAPAQFGGVTAFKASDLANFGTPYNVSVTVAKGDVAALRNFARMIEQWHDNAHEQIMMATGLDMMNPTTNLHLREFWRLHYFINAKFEAKLRSYRHLSSQSIPTVIAGIDANVHSSVPRI